MDKEDPFSPSLPPPPARLGHHEYSFDHQQQQSMNSQIDENLGDDNNRAVNYMMENIFQQQQQQQQHITSGFCMNNSLDKLSFVDVMQFADFGPKLALNHEKIPEEESGMDPSGYFLKFPVLNDKFEDETLIGQEDGFRGDVNLESSERDAMEGEEGEARGTNSSVQLQFLGENTEKKNPANPEGKSKRKRPRSVKTSEEVESQRMTHIAVERNRRKQMNEHLRVLRSLMPGSYVQRGDQASIIGGAIEFVRELEQLLQCLESQKRRRIFGGGGEDSSSSLAMIQPPHQLPQPPFFPPLASLQNEDAANFNGPREETAESKSCLADVEVKMLGFDAMIKILSKRRPQQLIKTIAALEDLRLNIVHTNITTIEHTVLYSFNVKVASESRFTAEDIASSVQQIFGFIHANSSIC